MFELIKLKIIKHRYKKIYGTEWKKYFMNPYRAFPDYMPIQFDGDENELADRWKNEIEKEGSLSKFLDNL